MLTAVNCIQELCPHGEAVAEPEEEHATVWVRGWNWGLGVRGLGSGVGGKGFRVRCYPEHLGVGVEVSHVEARGWYGYRRVLLGVGVEVSHAEVSSWGSGFLC
jgi:hypothetical protein